MRTRRSYEPETRIFAFFIITIIGILLITGCIKNGENSPVSDENVTPAYSPSSVEPKDFPVLISTNGLGPINGTIKKNLSEIVADNYTVIPNLLEVEHTRVCDWGPESDLNGTRKTALQNSSIRGMLQNGGIIKGIFVWGSPRYTNEMSAHPCDYVSLTLEMEYQGRSLMALINETDRTVNMPGDFPKPLQPYPRLF